MPLLLKIQTYMEEEKTNKLVLLFSSIQRQTGELLTAQLGAEQEGTCRKLMLATCQF